jgi:tripartite-type tricarboxylate transporter receptor subunit TctC
MENEREDGTMKSTRRVSLPFPAWALGLALFLLLLPCPINAQEFPTRAITLYCGYDAGAGTDITARSLAAEAEKILGVPIVVENKPGGGSTVCAALVASKKGDGYTLGLGSSQVITASPHLMTLSYNPLKDFTPVMQYSYYVSGLVVLSESPFKTIQDLIDYAKANPGMSYGSTGMYGQSHLSTSQLAKCKGLQLKHVPFKGGAAVATALLGKHVDMVTSGDRCMNYVKKGVMRLLVNYNIETRDPSFPDVPILTELGCRDTPPNRIFIFGPKGLPDPVSMKLSEAFKRASETPNFQKILKDLDLPYGFKSRSQLEKELPEEYEFLKNFFNDIGVKKGSTP